MINKGKLFLIVSMATHLGRKPKSGGRPPKESILIKTINFSFIF